MQPNASSRESLGPQGSALRKAAAGGAGLLALLALALELWRPESVPAETISLLSLVSIGVTTGQVLGYPKKIPLRAMVLLPFLPGLALAVALACFGVVEAASLLAVAAFAFQARARLLFWSEDCQEQRLEWAQALEARRPTQTKVFVDNDIESEVKADALREGHTFHLAPGQVIPADGLVTFGSGFVDENLVEAQSEDLRLKGMGSQVMGGARNKNGALLVRATAVGTDTFSSRLAARLRSGAEFNTRHLILLDAVFTLVALAVLVVLGPTAALKVFFVSSSAGAFAMAQGFELLLAEAAVAHRWLWKNAGGLRNIAKARMLVTPLEGVLREGRLKLVAVECTNRLSDSSAIALLGPLARKIESPAAFALLQELRTRNIPLQIGELFQPTEQGGILLVAGEEIGWIALGSPGTDALALGPLEAFVKEHKNAGDTVVLLERQSVLQAALAFRDTPIPGTAEAADTFRSLGAPVVLVSTQPKNVAARLQTEHGLEHARGETGPKEIEKLMEGFSSQKFLPAWVQTALWRPERVSAVVAWPNPGTEADLKTPHLDLPSLALAFLFARESYRKLRLSLACVYAAQALLLAALVVTRQHAWAPSLSTTAIAGLLPGFLSWLLLQSRSA